MESNKKTVLSIAGSDSSGGAGVQADLKAFTALGLHGATAITCVTAQNTQKVKEIYKIPAHLIVEQIETIQQDMDICAVKTGMLYDREITKKVADKIKEHNYPVVVDPVMVATSGDALSKKDLVKTFKESLLPKAYVLTPNINEANQLCNMEICTIEDVKKACEFLHQKGAKNIFIKGGHLEEETAKDVFYDGKEFATFSLPWQNKKIHGSGCSLSSLMAGYIALNEKPIVAAEKAKNTLWNMINHSYQPGKGANVLRVEQNIAQHTPARFETEKHFKVWYNLNKKIEQILSLLKPEFIPEVGTNIGYALPQAKKIEDICALEGRIIKTKNGNIRCGRFCFGGSKHIASVILTVMQKNPGFRCSMNIKYSSKNIEKCEKSDFKIGYFERRNEPKHVESTMEWSTKTVLEKTECMPDVIYDEGAKGKEPMIRILGRTPTELTKKISLINKK
ncbi:MAG: bifunctional hydroxymethylpyrimidine kinase/phosphomethylpyrimidine kinase [Candidatus Thermoplasmatota archaeon]